MSLLATPLLTIHDVARRLAVSKRTVWRWLTAGKLPRPLRLSSRCVRWRADDIDRYMDSLRADRDRAAPHSA